MPTDPAKALVVGIGEVGRDLLEVLAREERAVDIVAADVREDSVRSKVDNALFGASLHGRHPSITPIEIDLFDIDRTAEILDQHRPDVVINCSVLQTWHVIRRLPEDMYTRLSSAGLGAWLPVQLTLCMKLGQALDRSGISAHYINTSLSDLTNPVLGALGIPPTIGIGNVALIESAVRTLVARRSDVPKADVNITFIGSCGERPATRRVRPTG